MWKIITIIPSDLCIQGSATLPSNIERGCPSTCSSYWSSRKNGHEQMSLHQCPLKFFRILPLETEEMQDSGLKKELVKVGL